MTTTATTARVTDRTTTLEVRTRADCDRAVAIADEALANGDARTAERLCWLVLPMDLEHEGAFVLLQCVLLRGNRPTGAIGWSSRSHRNGICWRRWPSSSATRSRCARRCSATRSGLQTDAVFVRKESPLWPKPGLAPA